MRTAQSTQNCSKEEKSGGSTAPLAMEPRVRGVEEKNLITES